jgi:ERCC4-type nuclease
MSEKELLTSVDGIGAETAENALQHFDDGRKAAQSACRYWNEWTKVDGVSEDMARGMFGRMREAGVFYELREY